MNEQSEMNEKNATTGKRNAWGGFSTAGEETFETKFQKAQENAFKLTRFNTENDPENKLFYATLGRLHKAILGAAQIKMLAQFPSVVSIYPHFEFGPNELWRHPVTVTVAGATYTVYVRIMEKKINGRIYGHCFDGTKWHWAPSSEV